MFPMHFDQLGNPVQDPDVHSPCSHNALRTGTGGKDILTTTIIQQPAYDCSAGSVPRFFEDFASPRNRDNLAGDREGRVGKSKGIQNVGMAKERRRQQYETKIEQPSRVDNSVDMLSFLQSKIEKTNGSECVNTISFKSSRLDGNVPRYRFCKTSVSKRLPFRMLDKREKKELATKELGKPTKINVTVERNEVNTQELPSSPKKPIRAKTANPVQENALKNVPQTQVAQNDTPNNSKKDRLSPMERKHVNNVKMEDRTLLNLEARSLDNNVAKDRKLPTAVRLTHDDAKLGRHIDALTANRKKGTNSDNILQSPQRQVANETTTLKAETFKSNADYKESVMNITLLSFGIQNKTSTSNLDPGLVAQNGKRIVLPEGELNPEIDRLLSQLKEYMAHQEVGDGVGRGGSPGPRDAPTLQTKKKVTEKDEKGLPSTNHHQNYQVYRVQEFHSPSKPPCVCSKKGEDAGGSSASVSESEASDSSLTRSRRGQHVGHEQSLHRRQELFHSHSREIGVVDYEQERPARVLETRDGGRRREKNDADREKSRFKNEPTSYAAEAVSDKDDRVKRAERRKNVDRASERRSGADEARTPDGYRSVRAHFDLTSSSQDHRRHFGDEDVGKYDNRSSKRRSSKPYTLERDSADGTASRRRGGERRRSTSAPQDGRRHGRTDRHRSSFSDEETPTSVEEVVIRRYQIGNSARGKVETRSERSRQQRPATGTRRASPDGSEEDTRYAVKVGGRLWRVLEERGSNESMRRERRASDGQGRESIDARGSAEGRSGRDRYRRESNTSSIEQKEICRHSESRSSPISRTRSTTTYEPDDLGPEDVPDDTRPRRISHRGHDGETFRPPLDSLECETEERTRRKYSCDQREGHSKRATRKDRRRSAHFMDDVDAPASQRCSIDSAGGVSPRHRLESRRTSANPDTLDRKVRKEDTSERRPTFDSESRNEDNAQSSRIAEESGRRVSERPKRVNPEIASAEKLAKPPEPGKDSIEEIHPEKKVSKSRKMLENAYRFGKHPIQEIKTRRRRARSAKPDGASKSGDNQTDKPEDASRADKYRAISVQTSPTYDSTHRRSAGSSHHRTALRRGETLRLPSSHVIVNRGVLDSAPARYGAPTGSRMEARRVMICGDDDGVIDIRDKKLKKCFCGQTNKKNANAIDGFDLLCACDDDHCNCSPGKKLEAKTSLPKLQCPSPSHGANFGSTFSQNRPCERRKGEAADAVILVRSGKYLEVDVSADKKGRRACGSRAADASAYHRSSGRHADGGGYKSGRHRDSLGSNSSDLAAYRQGSSNSMMGFERDRGMVNKRYNIPPSKRGHGGKDGDLDDRVGQALGRDGRTRSGRGGEHDGDPWNSRGGRDGKSRGGRGGEDDYARNSGRDKDGKSRSGKGGDDDPRNSRGRGGKSGRGTGKDDDDYMGSKGGRDGKSGRGKGGDDDPRNSRGRGGKSGRGTGKDDDDYMGGKGGRDGKSGRGKGGDDDPRNSRGRGGKSGRGVGEDDDDYMGGKGGRDGKSRRGKGGDDDLGASRGGRGGKSGRGVGEDDEDTLGGKGGRDGKSRRGKGGDDDLGASRGDRGGKSGSGKYGENGAKNKKGMQSRSGSEKSDSDLDSGLSKKGKRGKKAGQSDKENQADLKAAAKATVDSGTGPDGEKGKKKKTRLRKETPEQRARRIKRGKERQEGGIYHGLILHTSEDDPSAMMNRGYRS